MGEGFRPLARREESEYREYSTDEQRSQRLKGPFRM
jgi:hypothetical protein